MTDDIIPRCILLAVLIIAGGVFSGAEIAFSYCNRTRMKTLAGEGNAAAKRVVEILAKYDKTIVTLLIVIYIIRVTAAAVSAVLATDLLGPAGSVAAAIVMTLFLFLIGETILKNIAHTNCDRYAMHVSLLIRLLSAVCTPISTVFTFTGDILKRLFHRGSKAPKLTEDEFQTIIENVEEEGVFEPDERQIICSAVEFGDLRACDVMTERENITAVDITLPPDKIRDKLFEEKFSRLPVFQGDLDHIVGVIQLRDYLNCLLNGEKEPAIGKIALQPYRVSPDIKLGTLFEGMSRRRSHLAVVTGTGGITLGIITMDDILKEIVGESLDGGDDGDNTKNTGRTGTAQSVHSKLLDNTAVKTAVSV